MHKANLFSPELINSNDFKMLGKKLKVAEEKTLRSPISMNHYKSGRVLFAFKSDGVDESWFIAHRAKPLYFRSLWSRPNANLFLRIGSPGVEANQQARLATSELCNQGEYSIQCFLINL